MRGEFCSCGNRFNPKDKFCTNCRKKKPRQKWGIGGVFIIILIIGFVGILGVALANLSNYAAEYSPYLFDQKGFQTEWNWEAGFDSGYYYAGSNDSFNNPDFENGYTAGKEIKLLEQKGKLILKDHSYKEMKKFLEADLTDRRGYVYEKYMCHHYSVDTVNHAKAKGIKAGYVHLDFPGTPAPDAKTDPTAHAIICFQTTDRGLIFIEPQSNKEVKVKIGESYWEQNTHFLQLNSGGVSGVAYDDTIIGIKITWSDGSETVIAEN